MIVALVWVSVSLILTRMGYLWGQQDYRLMFKNRLLNLLKTQPGEDVHTANAHYHDGLVDAYKEVTDVL